MRAAIAIVSVLAGCELATEDPVALLAARAPDATDCGAASVLGEPTPPWARACALAARGRGEAFRVVVDEPVADGRSAVGWIGDGAGAAGGWRLDYQAVYGMFLGSDDEDVAWQACAAIEVLPPDCASIDRDLCLRCR